MPRSLVCRACPMIIPNRVRPDGHATTTRAPRHNSACGSSRRRPPSQSTGLSSGSTPSINTFTIELGRSSVHTAGTRSARCRRDSRFAGLAFDSFRGRHPDQQAVVDLGVALDVGPLAAGTVRLSASGPESRPKCTSGQSVTPGRPDAPPRCTVMSCLHPPLSTFAECSPTSRGRGTPPTTPPSKPIPYADA